MTGPRFEVFQFNPNGVVQLESCGSLQAVEQSAPRLLLKTVASCASWIEILGGDRFLRARGTPKGKPLGDVPKYGDGRDVS
jgi:hypothetical protein